jgi:hypothetical protein
MAHENTIYVLIVIYMNMARFLYIHVTDVLVVVGGIPSWRTFLREEEDSRSQQKTIE